MSKYISTYTWPSSDIITGSYSAHSCSYSEVDKDNLIFSLINKQGGCTSIVHADSQRKVERGSGFRFRGEVSASEWLTLLNSSTTLLLYGDYYICKDIGLYKNGTNTTVAMNKGDKILCIADGYLNKDSDFSTLLLYETSFLAPPESGKGYEEYINQMLSVEGGNLFYELDENGQVTNHYKMIDLNDYSDDGWIALDLTQAKLNLIKAYVDMNTYRVDAAGRIYVRLKDGEQDE